MSTPLSVTLGTAPFDVGAELAALGPSGAVASFVGHVRADDGVVELFLEHHPVMTRAALQHLADVAAARWPLDAVRLIHRVGRLVAGDPIVLVAVAARHRTAALEACAFLIDRLKTDAPLWKRETLSDGSARWVEQRETDVDQAMRWA